MPDSGKSGLDLIHAGQRLAAALDFDWTVTLVGPARNPDCRLEIIRIVESLGGETVMLHGAATNKAVAAYARARQASKILIDSPTRVGWPAVTQYLRMAAFKRLAPGIEVIAISPGTASAEAHPQAIRWRGYLGSLGITALCTAAAFPIYGHVELINIVMLYTLGAAAAGLWLERGPSALAAVANVLAFDYFFEPPRFSFLVQDSGYLVTFAVMLAVALIIASLMIAVREQTEAAAAREKRAAAMYVITRELAVTRDMTSMAQVAMNRIGEELHCFALILLCDENAQLKPSPVVVHDSGQPLVDLSVAQWVADKQQRAGAGTPAHADDPAMYVPLVGTHAVIGVLVLEHIEGRGSLTADQQQLLDAIAGQLASALERARLTDVAHAAHLAAERAVMRNTLLASISHDLRTPLSAIAGAGSIVAQNDFALDIYRRVTLGRLIEDKARDMSELLSNVLELVRLESVTGGIGLGLAICKAVTRLHGGEIRATESAGGGARIEIDIPLPPVNT